VSGTTLKSNAQIAAPVKIRIAEIIDVEDILIESLKNYLSEFKFSELYANYTVRVGAVHPFALLLFQEVSGQALQFDVFPSVTIADMSDTQSPQMMAREEEPVVFQSDDLAILSTYRATGRIKVADTSWSALQSLVASAGKAYGTRNIYRKLSTVNFNIWSDNRELTTVLYDIVQLYIIAVAAELHNSGIQMNLEAITGNRSGDINIEFGKLLYGANLSIPVAATMSIASVQTDLSAITDIIHVAEDNIEGHVLS